MEHNNAYMLGNFSDIFARFRGMAEQYGSLPPSAMIDAFARAGIAGRMDGANPYIQNRRVKAVSSLPRDFTKNQVGEMLRKPDDNEKPLRQVAHGLEFTAYPLFHMRKVYQDLLSYHNYVSPAFAEEKDVKRDGFFREWRLMDKLRAELRPDVWAHQIVGQAIQEGKVFYHPRISVDKAHNKVNYAFMQQIPSDWVKIVGFNNVSKYTVAFDLMYFAQPGTDPLQFGDLFTPYMEQFGAVTGRRSVGKNVVFASGIDLDEHRRLADEGRLIGRPEVYRQNGRWCYWVTLPPETVWTFEIDDAVRTVVSPFVGLFMDFIQLSTYEQVQLELVQNPLVSVMTGEIPYRDTVSADESDPYKLSNAGRMLFEALWYRMLAENNTSGIGIYMAPLTNIRLHQLAEAPSAMDISSSGYSYTIEKSGMSALIPTSSDTRAGAAQISLQIESRYGQTVYRTFERMMDYLMADLRPTYEWRFTMFGSLATDDDEAEKLKGDMTLGILPATVRYLALKGMSIFDDLALSRAISESGLLDLRIPLISSYTASNADSGLPPKGGRPSSDGEATSDGAEGDLDSPSREENGGQ